MTGTATRSSGKGREKTKPLWRSLPAKGERRRPREANPNARRCASPESGTGDLVIELPVARIGAYGGHMRF
ncbi:hypothetical protein GCM10018965_006850 [Nonomuraea roseola]